MYYSDFKEVKISGLGFGCMRLPQNSEDMMDIDEVKTAEMVAYAIEHGINYFDTAWGYHGGRSELVIGKILEKYPRESFFLTNKFPGYDLNNMDKVAEIFEEQLVKCRVDYFDFYLFHNVYELNIDAYLDPKYGIADYLVKQKEAGRIKHLGFSLHGDLTTLKRFLDAYGDIVEFCQVELNYIDWTFQNAKEVVEILKQHNLPVWVMEPLRGGALAKMATEEYEKLKALRPNESIPAWAFRFVQTIPEVKVILSGMSTLEQLKENVITFEKKAPLNDKEFATLQEIALERISNTALPCTKCSYCVSHCPQKLDIPDLLEVYNDYNFSLTHGGNTIMGARIIMGLPEEKRPSACIACRSCESVCPQQIKIADALAKFADMVETP